MPAPPNLKLPLLLSIAAAILTIGLKSAAYGVTGSVSLLSDALESVVNLVAAVTAYFSLRYAEKPVDSSHTYGHQKIEFFSSGTEGVLILVAALAIAWQAVARLIRPQDLDQIGLGLGISLAAAAVNGAVGLLLIRVGRRHRSIILEADGKHLLTDVWTTGGVAIGLLLVTVTGVVQIDAVVALVVAANILWTAASLIRRSFDGLMDHALPGVELDAVRAAIASEVQAGMAFHALRTRQAGAQRFVDFHLLVPGAMTVREAHDLIDRIEAALDLALPGVGVTVHVEPIEERRAWEDSALVPLEEAAGLTRRLDSPP